MVSLQTVRAHNATLKELGPGLVVGGTSGIGSSTAREFVRHTLAPRVYLVGRNETQASRIISELRALNPEGQISFVKSDVSLLRNVDAVCDEIKAKEEKVNLLVLSQGVLTTKGRDETPEGLDKKLSLHYYSRMRFVHNLLPQLTAAATATATAAGASSSTGNGSRLSRVITVLSTGSEGRLKLDDLSLKTHYSLARASTHAITMSSLAISELAAAHPETTFIHSFPGAVNTNLMRDFNPFARGLVSGLMFLLKPLTVPLAESGERHLYAATSGVYPPRAQQQQGAGAGKDTAVATGADGLPGSGAYLLHWDGSTPNKKAKLLREYQSSGVGKQVWAHTLEVFEKICSRGRYD
ncbi:hypothetical protein T310_7704 [Rasamsonia emersonii CBS 393.64]|uniref:Short-chain dehydrogenase/reductase n=1 Tax=Rasamsonia emersonii (strain ATCC 16479 / CBS 393.64 / IMI 116815) TaxID=1408163 RepID=A0A0F4YKG6_RASE3|nr:hypothetical protein T310_7704 [Rasamsonia emersonii CBS 393.64]KKA18356.1 hypothetical protein T310_7704 [Rasamsonia emersonii CBS 393.64]